MTIALWLFLVCKVERLEYTSDSGQDNGCFILIVNADQSYRFNRIEFTLFLR